MKKSIIISLFALLISAVSFAQPKPHEVHEFKAPSVEQIAQWRADHLQKKCKLEKNQYDKIYKLYLKQAKKDAARMEQIKKEQEKMNAQLKKILNDEQWADYKKMQKRHKFGWRKPMPHPAKPDMRPAKGPWEKPQQGPKIEMPESRRNNMFIEK